MRGPVGLFELPAGDAPPGGYRLVSFAGSGEDAGLEVRVEEKLLTPETLRRRLLLFNIEGRGRFRLWFDAAP